MEERKKQHIIIFTDMASGGVRVVDLDTLPSDQEISLAEKDTVWSFVRSEDKGWDMTFGTKNGIDDAKLRYSNYHQKQVVLMTSSCNWAGVAEYPSGKCLWETRVGCSPHSIEMLPNGDIVIAVSGEDDMYSSTFAGSVIYYHMQEDGQYQQTSRKLLRSAHGVLWDPKENLIWALGMNGLVAYEVDATYALEQVEGKGFEMLCGGHALSVDYQNPDLLWIGTAIDKLFKFSKDRNQVLDEYLCSDVMLECDRSLINAKHVKGVTSFEDGVIALCKSKHCSFRGDDTVPGYATDTIYVVQGNEVKKYIFKNLYLYKLSNFVTDYDYGRK